MPTQQEAKAARAKAAVLSAEVAVKKADANVTKARAILTQRLEMNKRRQELVARQATSTQAAEEAQRDEDVAKAELLVAESDIEVAKAQITDARAQFAYEKAILEHIPFSRPSTRWSSTARKSSASDQGRRSDFHPRCRGLNLGAGLHRRVTGWGHQGGPAGGGPPSLPPHEVFQARVVRVGIESDRVSEERRVYVKCEQCPVRFHLGEQVEVLITVATLSKARLVPEAAVTGFDGARGKCGRRGGRLKRRLVSFGYRTEDSRLEVRDGLPQDADVVSLVSPSLQEGRRARAIREAAP